jgi:hypothetical protein
MATVVKIDQTAVDTMVHDPEGEVGQYLMELGEKMTAIARAKAPIQTPGEFSWGKRFSSSYEPWGADPLKGRIHSAFGVTTRGELYAGVNAPYAPTLWLERPRVDRRAEPFLTDALYSVAL